MEAYDLHSQRFLLNAHCHNPEFEPLEGYVKLRIIECHGEWIALHPPPMPQFLPNNHLPDPRSVHADPIRHSYPVISLPKYIN